MRWFAFIVVMGCRLDMSGPTQEAVVLSGPMFMNVRFPMSNLLNWDVFGYRESSAYMHIPRFNKHPFIETP